MLGTARASQYAGWWSGGNPSVVFRTTSDLTYTNQQTGFSLLHGVGGSPAGDFSIVNSGNYDITGYSSLTGFNNSRNTQVMSVYIEWPTSGIPTGAFVGFGAYSEMKQDGTVIYYNPQLQLANANTQLQILGGIPGGNSFNLPGNYAQYMNRWLTIIYSASETAASYTNWANPGGTGVYCRQAVFDSESGVLIGKNDFRNSNTLAQWSTWPNTIPANINDSAYGASIGAFGSGPFEGTYYNTRLSNYWASFGTMFDPLTTTNTSWRTTRPSATIDTAKAWLNYQAVNYELVGTPGNYFVNTSGMDLYSQANNRVAKNNGWSVANWDAIFSDTIKTKDSG